MRNLAALYKELSDADRSVYTQKAENLRDDYIIKKKEFL